MGVKQIPDLPELAVSPDAGDLLIVRDVSANADRKLRIDTLLSVAPVKAVGRVTAFDVIDNQANNWTDLGFEYDFLFINVVSFTPTTDSSNDVKSYNGFHAAVQAMSAGPEKFFLLATWSDEVTRVNPTLSGTRISTGVNFSTEVTANNYAITFDYFALRLP